jgi:hypothetical protein
MRAAFLSVSFASVLVVACASEAATPTSDDPTGKPCDTEADCVPAGDAGLGPFHCWYPLAATCQDAKRECAPYRPTACKCASNSTVTYCGCDGTEVPITCCEPRDHVPKPVKDCP